MEDADIDIWEVKQKCPLHISLPLFQIYLYFRSVYLYISTSHIPISLPFHLSIFLPFHISLPLSRDIWDCICTFRTSIQGGEDSQDPLSLQVIFRKSDLYLVVPLWKMICNLRDPMNLRHSVSLSFHAFPPHRIPLVADHFPQKNH